MAVPTWSLDRYLGTWYEQAHLPMFFQRKCAQNTTATYGMRPDGQVSVTNRCETSAGETIEAKGVAKLADPRAAELKVRFAPDWLSFIPMVWADYWVIALDPQYQWAVVGEPRREYLWILTRDKTVPADQLKVLVAKAQAQGFPVEKLVYTPQK